MSGTAKRSKRSDAKAGPKLGMAPAPEAQPRANVVDLFASLGVEVDRSEPEASDRTLDGERLVFEAEREIVIRCGQASITLTRSGKIVLRGTHVVSKSSGANRVLGTTVRIN